MAGCQGCGYGCREHHTLWVLQACDSSRFQSTCVEMAATALANPVRLWIWYLDSLLHTLMLSDPCRHVIYPPPPFFPAKGELDDLFLIQTPFLSYSHKHFMVFSCLEACQFFVIVYVGICTSLMFITCFVTSHFSGVYFLLFLLCMHLFFSPILLSSLYRLFKLKA